jgi:hypothetical protein
VADEADEADKANEADKADEVDKAVGSFKMAPLFPFSLTKYPTIFA